MFVSYLIPQFIQLIKVNEVPPVLFLIFNRPATTARVFEQIRAARPKQLFVAADGPRMHIENDVLLCEKVRQIVKLVDWDCELKTLFRTENLGCGRAVSEAITWFFKDVEQGIILEDDCLPDLSFFSFCETLLNYYRNEIQIMHIGGTNFQYGKRQRGEGSYYFSKYCHVWGWATWRRAWEGYDLAMRDCPDIVDGLDIEDFWKNIFRSNYVAPRSIDTWDYQWFYSVCKNKGLAIIPNKNLVQNIGFGENATHTKFLPKWLMKHQIQSLKMPILHPKTIEPHFKADNYTFRTHYGQRKMSFWERFAKKMWTYFKRKIHK